MKINKTLATASITYGQDRVTDETHPITDIQPIQLLFTDLTDAASCLSITPTDCDKIQALSSQYDVAKWVGTIICNKPKYNDCADCYTHVDGVNIIGVVPLIKEELREPWLIDSQLTANHSLVKNSTFNTTPVGTDFTPAYYREGSRPINNYLNTTVDWDDIRAFGGKENITVTELSNIPTISNVQSFNRTAPVEYYKSEVMYTTDGASTFKLENRADPVLDAFEQTPNTQNYAIGSALVTKTTFNSATQTIDFNNGGVINNLQLCGMRYEVKEYGSVYQGTLEGYAQNIAWLDSKGLSTKNAIGPDWIIASNVPVDGNNVLDKSKVGTGTGEAYADFHTRTGLWRGNTFKPIDLVVPTDAKKPE